MSDTFKCAMCGETFRKGRTDQEALEETRQYFGDVPAQDLEAVCEDCYQKIDPETTTHDRPPATIWNLLVAYCCGRVDLLRNAQPSPVGRSRFLADQRARTTTCKSLNAPPSRPSDLCR